MRAILLFDHLLGHVVWLILLLVIIVIVLLLVILVVLLLLLLVSVGLHLVLFNGRTRPTYQGFHL